MKKIISIVLILIFVFTFVSCEKEEVDYDLTKMSKHSAIDFIIAMAENNESNKGQVVKISGKFNVYEEGGMRYFMVTLEDSEHGHTQALEFVLDGDYTYPDDYPSIGTNIIVTGTFNTYIEDGNTYCFLDKASIEIPVIVMD